VFGKGYKSGVPLLYLVRGLLGIGPEWERPYEVHLRSSFQFEKCISVLGIIYMSIVRWVFFYRENGGICRSRTAMIAVPERQILPVRSGDLGET
jgi:hypothetical protein